MVGAALVKAIYALPTWARTVRLIAEHAALRDAVGGTPSALRSVLCRCSLRSARDLSAPIKSGAPCSAMALLHRSARLADWSAPTEVARDRCASAWELRVGRRDVGGLDRASVWSESLLRPRPRQER
jgi:hypothetical protein